jgi:hypothetical protein
MLRMQFVLKNEAQQPLGAVVLEFKSVKARNDVLGECVASAMFMKHKIVAYYAQAKVVRFSNCFEN